MKIAASSLFLGLALIGSAAAQGTPQNTVRGFAAAWNSRHYADAATLVDGGNSKVNFGPYRKFLDQAKVSDLSGIAVTESEGKAVVKYRYTKSRFTRDESVHLRQVGGRWVIVAEEHGSMLGGFAYALLHPELVEKAMAAAHAAVALSDVKQLALGCLILTTDNDDLLKLMSSNAQKKLDPYIRNPEVWTAPGDPKGTQSFTINDALAGKDFTRIRLPAKTVLIYEGRDSKPKFRYAGRAAIGFADGHAKLISRSDAARLVWKP